MQKLVDEGYLNKIVETQKSGTSFEWHVDMQKWLYSLFEIADDTVPTYSFSGSSVDDYLNYGNWRLTDNGFTASNGMMFIPNNNDEYTITTEAKLSDGTGGGYGILFETEVAVDGSDIDDTGYALQFDRGYNAIIVRPREDGREYSPEIVVRHEDSPIIPESKGDEWWSLEHTLTMKVEDDENGDGKKELSLWIDGTLVINKESFDTEVEKENNFTGFRSWWNDTEYKQMDIE